MKKISVIALAITCIIFACSRKANPVKTEGAKTDASKEPQVTYAMDIRPLIQNKCTPCHVPSKGGFKTALDTYADSKRYIDDMISRIQLSQGDPKYMPFKKPPLDPHEISLFKKWKEQGLQEN